MSPSRNERLRQLAPFIGTAFFPFLLLPLPGTQWNGALLVVAFVLTCVLLSLAVLVPWERLPYGSSALPALAYLIVVSMLREAGGGTDSGLGPMVLLPVIWLALYGTPAGLACAIVGVAMVYWVPIPLDPTGERYPESGLRVGAIFIPLLAMLGFTVQRLHGQVRDQAGRLARLAHTDELTGLPNRRAWDVALDAVLHASEREGTPSCIALIDVDRFKEVNDRDGHGAGDALLVTLTEAWLVELRRGDTLARIGGDEFAVLLPNCTAQGAEHVLERVLGARTAVSASIGLAERSGEERAAELIGRADAALYDAKRGGGARLSVADPSSSRVAVPA